MHSYNHERYTDDNHVNAFIDLNGVPYLLAEYLDRNQFQQIDRSQIRSEFTVDQSNAMRAVVDINIDDIGKRSTDGLPAIVGNNSKQKKLLDIISMNANNLNGQLGVLKRGIVIRVSYQLENYRTGKVIRSMTEDFRINDRNYFLDINPRDINDNAIVVNFTNTIVSTINEFTHGRDPMMIRVTNIQMFYEIVKSTHKPRLKQSMSWNGQDAIPTSYSPEHDFYYHHKEMQNHHIMPMNEGPYHYGNEHVSMISPNKWTSFNRFYHFDKSGADIVLHYQEINDSNNSALLPCGTVRVNRTFMINPGHRIIFKFSIWKNDLTVVADTTKIAQGLRVPLDNGYYPMYPDHSDDHCHHDHHDHHSHGKYSYQELVDMLKESHRINYQQSDMINELNKTVDNLSEMVNNLMYPEVKDECCDPCNDEHERLEEMIEAIPEVQPISNDIIQNIVDIVAENTFDDFD